VQRAARLVDPEPRLTGAARGFGSWERISFAALLLSLVLAWLNFLTTGRWASVPGALQGARGPFYGASLLACTVITVLDARRVGRPVDPGRAARLILISAGVATLAAALFSRFPLSVWTQIPFSDDWAEHYQQSVNGLRLIWRGSFVGWNWWLQGGYPTSTDLGQNFATIALLPMWFFGPHLGHHVLLACLFFGLPALVWWDIRQEDRSAAIVAAGFAAFLTAGYFATIGNSGDSNSLVGVFSVAVVLAGSRAARLGRRWGGPLLLTGLTLGLYTHAAFFVYAVMLLVLEAAYFRDRAAAVRLVATCALAVVAGLPMHWESLRHSAYVSFNNAVFNPSEPKHWGLAAREVFYNIQILALPHRWFNDYRSLTNVWLPILIVCAAARPRSRTGFFASAAVLVQLLLRFSTSEAGTMLVRTQYLFPILTAPALAGFVVRTAGTRRLAISAMAVIALYVAVPFAPIPHVPELRAWDPPLIDRITAAPGNMVLVEFSPHRDMDADPRRRTPTTPFGVHFEALLPDATGHRFYSQLIDGWAFNVWRGEILAAGTWQGRPISETPVETFAGEMRRWGVADLFVWTDASRSYLARSGRFTERWHEGLWSEFEMTDADTRAVVMAHGRGELAALDLLGGDVRLVDARAGDIVVVRTHDYPAWRAHVADRRVPLFAVNGQIGFRAPSDGRYTVRLDYPRYHALSLLALSAFGFGVWLFARWPRRR
jgi:hypothetical protein